MAVPFLGHFTLHVGLKLWLLMASEAVLWALASIFVYRALEHLSASIVSILQTMSTLLSLILAYLVLHQTVRHMQLLGAIVLMITVWTTLWLASQED